jgi:fucose permease
MNAGSMELSALVLFALLGIAESSIGALLPAFQQIYRLPESTLALLTSAFFAGSLISTIVSGTISSTWMGRGVMYVMMVIFASGQLGLAFVPGWWGKSVRPRSWVSAWAV